MGKPVASEDFFGKPTESSLIKVKIVSRYFNAWADIIIPSIKRKGRSLLAYVDLLAGPGRYDDGTLSTPLRVLQSALMNKDMCEMLLTVFNDKDPVTSKKLQAEVSAFTDIPSLKHYPRIYNLEVGTQIIQEVNKVCTVRDGSRTYRVPTLLFLDPWGYKGLTLELINNFVKDWACECIFCLITSV